MMKKAKKLFVLILLSAWVAPLLAGDPVVITIEPDQFYFHPNTDQELSFLAYSRGIDQEELHYSIYDLYGNEVLKDTAYTTNGIDITTSVNLDRGYYRIYFPDLDTYFGLTVLPFRDREPDRFFGVHAALTKNDELVYLSFAEEGARHESLVKTLEKTGIGLVRERVRPATYAPSPGVIDYDPSSHRYEDARQLYEAYGIDVMGFFAITNWWMRRPNDRVNPTERHNRFPLNMHAITDTWDSIANRWGETLTKIEIWNEPRSGTQDRLAPLYHAMAYSFDGMDNPKLLGSGYTAGTMEKYIPDMGRMKALDVIDKISFHQYTGPEVTGNMTTTVRGALKPFGLETMPVINSESGAQYVGGIWPSFAQDITSGAISSGRAAENKAFGQEHFCHFVYSPAIREEFDKVGESICVSGTASLNFAAYVTSALFLSHREYIGDLNTDLPNVMMNHVFAGQDTAVVTLFRDSEGSVDLPSAPIGVYGMDGRPVDFSGTSVTLTDPMVYAIFKRTDMEGHVTDDTEAMPSYQLAKEPFTQSGDTYPVSVLHVPDYLELEFSNSAYVMNTILDGSATLSYEAYNLSNQEQTVDLALTLPGWLQTSGDTVKTVTIPPKGDVAFSWEVTFNPESDGFQGEVWVEPVNGTESVAHPLMYRVQCKRPLENILDSYHSYRKLYLFDPSKWNEYGKNEAEIDVNVAGDTVLFQMNVSDEKDWMAGTYNVSDVDFTHVKGFFADARIDAKPDDGNRFWPLMKFGFLEGGDGGHYYCKEFPLEGDRTWVYAELDDIPIDLNDENQNLDRDEIVRFRARFRQGRPGVDVNAELYALYLVSDTLLFSDTLFNCEVRLLDKDSGDPLQGIEVVFGEDTLATGDDGRVEYEKLPYGYYDLEAEVEGYYPDLEERYIELHQDTSFTFSLQKQRPDVTLQFSDGQTGDPVSGVEIMWQENQSFSNAFGIAELQNIMGDTLIFTAAHDAYFNLTDTVAVRGDTSLVVEMFSQYADIAFEITNETGAMSGAIVTLGGMTDVTNPSGQVTYYDQLAREMYVYEVEADGYVTYEDSLFLETDTLLNILMNPVSTGVSPDNGGLNVYPNPTSNLLNVEFENHPGVGYHIKLCNLLGDVVWERRNPKGALRIKMDFLAEGIYFLKLESNHSNYYRRILLVR